MASSYSNYVRTIAPVKGSSGKNGMAPVNPMSPLSTTARIGPIFGGNKASAKVAANPTKMRGSSANLGVIAQADLLRDQYNLGFNPGGGPDGGIIDGGVDGGYNNPGGNGNGNGNNPGGSDGRMGGKGQVGADYMDPFEKWPRKDNQSKGIKETWHRRFRRKPGRRGSYAIAGKRIYAQR